MKALLPVLLSLYQWWQIHQSKEETFDDSNSRPSWICYLLNGRNSYFFPSLLATFSGVLLASIKCPVRSTYICPNGGATLVQSFQCFGVLLDSLIFSAVDTLVRNEDGVGSQEHRSGFKALAWAAVVSVAPK